MLIPNACGNTGWFGSEADSWLRITGDNGLAIRPLLVPIEDGMAHLEKGLDDGVAISSVPEFLGAHPNPFNPRIVLQYTVPTTQDVVLNIYDVQGGLVCELVSGTQPAGINSVSWYGVDDRGRRVASGIYLVEFKSGAVRQTRRIVMVK